MKIGVFDSGLGGQSVANAIMIALPTITVHVQEDRENVPYGDKSPEDLLSLTVPILTKMVESGCKIIVIACNTVSTTIIEQLRSQITVPLIAVEPMVRPAAALTKSNTIAVCATPATLRSDRYAWLKNEYAKAVTVIEPDCSKWSMMIESNDLDVRTIADSITAALDAGADVIVLGCTHYHWIEHEIRTICYGRAEVLQPEQAIVKQVKRVLERLA